MKKRFAVLITALLLTGCVPNWSGTMGGTPCNPETEAGETHIATDTSDALTHEVVSTGPGEPHPSETNDDSSHYPNAAAKVMQFDDLTVELENAISRLRRETEYANNPMEFGTYIYDIYSVFVDMLDYRESLDYFNESKEYPLGERGFVRILITAGSVFTEGGTCFRVIEFNADSFHPHMLHLQVFNNETVNSQNIYNYWSGEGGVEGKIVHYSFHHDQDRLYLTVIHKEKRTDGSDCYILVNYKIDGNAANNYDALRKEISNGTWTIRDDSSSENWTVLRVAYSGVSWFDGYNFDNDSQLCFEDNMLTIILNNKEKDEISLIFRDGFWDLLALPSSTSRDSS